MKLLSQANFTFQISTFLLNVFAHADGHLEKHAMKQTLYFFHPPPLPITSPLPRKKNPSIFP